MATPTTHSKCSPSGAHRWLNCTAAPTYEGQFSEGEVSIYARTGTTAHKFAELAAQYNLNLINKRTYNARLKKLQADELYDPRGVIAESEANASRLFGARTLYSAGGSSLAIRAMLWAALSGSGDPRNAVVLAGRNAHRAFLSAAALIGFDVAWLHPKPGDAYHGCTVTASDVEAALERLGERCRAVYLTSPDYLGHMQDIAAVAAACRRYGAKLLVDNAHGAYLKFLPGGSRHPVDLGADLCCDSAHKTLPALTGAAYLHIRPGCGVDPRRAREAMALFGSSSPSWLALQSLDACNPYLEGLPASLAGFLPKVDALKAALTERGWRLAGDEPMKLTLAPRVFGWTGDALAERLSRSGVVCEFHDPDFITLMPSPMNTASPCPTPRRNTGPRRRCCPPGRPPSRRGRPCHWRCARAGCWRPRRSAARPACRWPCAASASTRS